MTDIDDKTTPEEFAAAIESIQQVTGKTIIEVHNNREKYLDVMLAFNKENSQEENIAMFAANVISRIKTVEILVMTTLLAILKEQGAPDDACGFINKTTWDMVSSLFLLNNLATEEELRAIYPEEHLEVALGLFKNAEIGKDTTKIDLHEETKHLKEMLKKHRDAKEGSLN